MRTRTKKRAKRARQRWSMIDDAALNILVEREYSVHSIARVLGRTHKAISDRKSYLKAKRSVSPKMGKRSQFLLEI